MIQTDVNQNQIYMKVNKLLRLTAHD